MFKAKIIEDENYYSLKRKQLLIITLLFIPLGLFFILFSFSIWLEFIFASGYLYVAFLVFKSSKSIRSTLNNYKIEICSERIRIVNRFNEEIELYKVSKITEIEVMKEYKLPQEDVKDIILELFGKHQISYIKIFYHNESKQINFEIDSIYMLNRLNEVVNDWSKSGVKLNKTT